MVGELVQIFTNILFTKHLLDGSSEPWKIINGIIKTRVIDYCQD